MSGDLDYRHEHIFRSEGAVAFAVVGCAIATLLIVITALEGGSAAWDVLAGLIGMAGSYVTVRTARAGIVTRQDAILVRGLFRTRRVEWRDLDDVTTAPAVFTLNPRAVRIGLRLRDGRILSTSVLGAGRSSTRAMQQATDGLRELLRQHRTYDRA